MWVKPSQTKQPRSRTQSLHVHSPSPLWTETKCVLRTAKKPLTSHKIESQINSKDLKAKERKYSIQEMGARKGAASKLHAKQIQSCWSIFKMNKIPCRHHRAWALSSQCRCTSVFKRDVHPCRMYPTASCCHTYSFQDNFCRLASTRSEATNSDGGFKAGLVLPRLPALVACLLAVNENNESRRIAHI